MKTAIFRTFGGSLTGYGHYFRLLSLAKAMQILDGSVNIVFLINDDLIPLMHANNFDYRVSNNLDQDYSIVELLGAQLFIWDSYLGTTEYLENVSKICKLIVIDDNNDLYDLKSVDLLINGNLYATDLEYVLADDAIKLLGLNYALLKEEYWKDNRLYRPEEREGLLITTGGSDYYSISLMLLNKLKLIDIPKIVIIGPGYTPALIKKLENIADSNVSLVHAPASLKAYIQKSKVVITAGGSTIYEVLLQGVLPITFSIAENQKRICRSLVEQDYPYLGHYPEIDYSLLLRIIEDIFKNHDERIPKVGFDIDGRGALRVAEEVLKLFKDSSMDKKSGGSK